MLHDAHAHLTEPEYRDTLPHILALCRRAGIRILCVSSDLETSRETLRLGRAVPDLVVPFVGLHPWSVDETQLQAVMELLEAPEVRGVGEIGLDGRALKARDGALQRRAFTLQLELAERRGIPVSIHSRDAVGVVMEVLSSYRLRGVLLHWFMGEPRQLAEVQDRGYFVSFGPSLFYSRRAVELASKVDRRSILLESDGPVRYGDLFGGLPASPLVIPSVAYRLAGIWRASFEDVVGVLEENMRLFLHER